MSEKPLVPAEVRNRIVEVRKARYGDIKQLPHNPKDHPEFQRQAFRGAVRQIGFAGITDSLESPPSAAGTLPPRAASGQDGRRL